MQYDDISVHLQPLGIHNRKHKWYHRKIYLPPVMTSLLLFPHSYQRSHWIKVQFKSYIEGSGEMNGNKIQRNLWKITEPAHMAGPAMKGQRWTWQWLHLKQYWIRRNQSWARPCRKVLSDWRLISVRGGWTRSELHQASVSSAKTASKRVGRGILRVLCTLMIRLLCSWSMLPRIQNKWKTSLQ